MVGKEFPAFPSHLKRRHSLQERREELQCRATIPRVPQMSQSIPGKTVFPALPRISSRGSTHNLVARGTALWESFVGMPPGKASRKDTNPLIHAKGNGHCCYSSGGKHTCIPPLERRTDSPGEYPEVPLRFMSALDRNPQVPALAPHKVLGPSFDGRGIPRGPRATLLGTGLS